MKPSVVTVLLTPFALLPLVGCHQSATDNLAARVENAADMRAADMRNDADALRDQAAMLDNQARATERNGDRRADAIRAADMNVSAMSPEQRDAIVANQAPAVR